MWQNDAQISCPGKCLFTRVSCHSAFQQRGTLWGMGASRAWSCSAWALAKALAAPVLKTLIISADKLWSMLSWWLRSFWDTLSPSLLLCYYSNWAFGLWRATSQAVIAFWLRRDLQNENRQKAQNNISHFWEHLGFSIFWFSDFLISARCFLFPHTFKMWLIL